MTTDRIYIDRSPQRTAALAGIRAGADLFESFANSAGMDAFDLAGEQPTVTARWRVKGLYMDLDPAAITTAFRNINHKGTGTMHISYQTTGYTAISYGFVQVYDYPYDKDQFRYAVSIDLGTFSHDRFVDLWNSLDTTDHQPRKTIMDLLTYIDTLPINTGYSMSTEDRVILADLLK